MSIDYSMPDSAWIFDFQVENTQYRFGEIENIPSFAVMVGTQWEPYFHAAQWPMDWPHIKKEGVLVHPGRQFVRGNAIDESDCMFAFLRKILFLVSRQLTEEDHPFANDSIEDIPVSDWAPRVGVIAQHIEVNGSTLTV